MAGGGASDGGAILGIFGAGRNGSTLLMRLLDGSPGLWVHPVELNYLSPFSDLLRYGRVRLATAMNATTRQPLLLSGQLDSELLLRSFAHQFDELQRTYLDNLAEPLEADTHPTAALSEGGPYAPSAFLPELLKAVSAAYDRRSSPVAYHVFKSIETPYIRDYQRTFPGMRFLHILRDPITNYSSLKRTNMVRKGWPFWQHGGDELRMLLETRWLPHAHFLVEHHSSKDPRHFLVRYEDLCRAPEEVVDGVCRWLGVAPPRECIQSVLGGRKMRELPVNASKIGVATPERVVANMASEYSYEEVLTLREREFILSRTSDLARRLGYAGDESRPTLRTRVDLARRWFLPDRWELMNARSKPRLARALLARRWYLYRSLFL